MNDLCPVSVFVKLYVCNTVVMPTCEKEVRERSSPNLFSIHVLMNGSCWPPIEYLREGKRLKRES